MVIGTMQPTNTFLEPSLVTLSCKRFCGHSLRMTINNVLVCKAQETLEETLARFDHVAEEEALKAEEHDETTASLTIETASLVSPPIKHKPVTPEEIAVLREMTTIIGSDPFEGTKPHFIPLLEARGGTDKDPATGHRRDSVPIASLIENETTATAIFQYQEGDSPVNDILRRYLLQAATGVVVRNNPGTLSPASQAQLDVLLTELGLAGVHILSSPTVQKLMGAKDALFKIRGLSCGMHDTAVYYSPECFREGFRQSICQGPRVIKQNR
jgi:hypothetical protein